MRPRNQRFVPGLPPPPFATQIDAIGTKRFDSDQSGDREVQRTMLELLNQLDGFSTETTIKVSMNCVGGHGAVLGDGEERLVTVCSCSP